MKPKEVTELLGIDRERIKYLMGPDEQVEHFRKHCEKIKTDKTVCYCKFCTDAINMGGKQGIHLLEILFPAREEFR